jgi:RNA polymerase-binding transcription factor DksA
MATSSHSHTTAPAGHPDLTDAERARLRAALEEERASLLERTTVDEHDPLLQSSATRGQGETEHTVNEIERSVHAVLDANAREALSEIDAALARLADGTYGLWEGCGRPIPAERLAALPAARLCVACQQRQQQQARR